MPVAGFGKPKYGFTGSNNWSIKEGDNIYRFMPPMHSLAESGRWTVYDGTHFGYVGRDPQAPNDPSKKRVRTFLCIEKKGRGGIVEQNCPESDLIAQYTEERDAKEVELKKAKVPEDQIATELAVYNAWLKAHNCSWKHHINAMNQQGQFGEVQVSHRTKKKIDDKFKELREKENIDPLDPEQGVWVNIRRVGKKLEAEDTIEILTDEQVIPGGRKAFVTRLAPLTPEQCAAALEQCRDLTTLGTVLSYEQIEALTKCSGDPSEVDAIFARSEKKPTNANSPKPQTTETAQSTNTTTTSPRSVLTPPTTSAPPPQANPPSPPAEKSPAAAKNTPAMSPALAARLAEIQRRKEEEEKRKEQERIAAEAAAKAESTAKSEPSDVDLATMTDEEVLAFFEGQNKTS